MNLRIGGACIGGLALMAAQAMGAEVGLKNFLQIPYALESATNISHKNPEFVSFFNNQKTKFPQKGELSEVTVPMVLAQMSYGSLFCEKMIVKDMKLPPASRWVHSQLDFSKPLESWESDKLVSVANEYASIFWLRELLVPEQEVLSEEIPALRDSMIGGSGNVSQSFLVSLCSVFAGSFGFMIL